MVHFSKNALMFSRIFLLPVLSVVLDGNTLLVRTVLEERTVFLNNIGISGSVERSFTFSDRFKCIWYIRRSICPHLLSLSLRQVLIIYYIDVIPVIKKRKTIIRHSKVAVWVFQKSFSSTSIFINLISFPTVIKVKLFFF